MDKKSILIGALGASLLFVGVSYCVNVYYFWYM